ncbi:MAG: PA2169 family four-helix-bundle protein [Chloroflexi bacterium]|nr:PA2169 family four-helix-bundle protein [Chloroflexota bacterium]MBP8058488.1 PA2169 family four-helix-bundle protein [Chloroflexota bacterium]
MEMEVQRHLNPIPVHNATDVVALLNELLTVVHDSLNGYRTVVEALEDGQYVALFNEYAQQREQMGTELTNLVVRYGGHPQQNGTVGAALHRVWMNIKAAATQGDASILAECDVSEEATLKAYQDAVASVHLPEEVREVIRNQMTLVRLAHERVHALKALVN